MAEDGWSSEEMANEAGLDEEATRAMLKREGIRVPADEAKVVENIDLSVGSINYDAKEIWTDVESVDFSRLDRDRKREWSKSLGESIDLLEKLRRLIG